MSRPDYKTAILRRALAGESLTLDREFFTLHDLTQIAVALREDANLAIRNADMMTPIERASVESAGRGRIVFLKASAQPEVSCAST